MTGGLRCRHIEQQTSRFLDKTTLRQSDSLRIGEDDRAAIAIMDRLHNNESHPHYLRRDNEFKNIVEGL